MIGDWLANGYLWIKALHVISVIAWMAGLFYLPRLYVHHTEKTEAGTEMDTVFQMMERKLLKLIMNPSMIASWLFGLLLVLTPGIVDWSAVWPYTKGLSILAMTWFHMWLAAHRHDFVKGEFKLSGRTYRMMNELPTVLMIVIVISVIVRF
ncbi:protoporphyrinogen oxidase HemJ [Tropicimonas sp. TH_r6]|uniref:protoporphyrinogen oxidase HemJ n=1 Tax=Tropicimonas sp. TH_r6 TaxID=3082085 RepID=UPI0029555CC1|nr:protoporphyrinogen oxidase HemJ [Tropicimonas sp. TH_r6]MDV7141279.1 protoporphyrinogen oxidase HemJ [Tropicimonas sp. TH_r6]